MRVRSIARLFSPVVAGVVAFASAASADEASPPEAACEPACRAGYACVKGVCMSACNPPCAASETCTAAGQCAAKMAPPPPVVPARPDDDAGEPARKPKGIETHDGFYLRLGVGAGHIASTVSDSPEAKVSDWGVAAELAMGGTPFPGFVVGGGIYGVSMSKPTLTQGSQTLQLDTVTLSMIGPFVDWYPSPKGGFHVQASVGATRLVYSAQPGIISGSGTGAGVMGGVGYEAFVSEQWSLGVVARVQWAGPSLTVDTTGGSKSWGTSNFAPAILFVGTYH